tara:strand:- start:830 stop:1480 length:651 start_codon:yes stop_codon:yes gene_type:complete
VDEELANINSDLNREKIFSYYNKNKKKILVLISICLMAFFVFIFYKYYLETKRSKLAEKYIEATLQVKTNNKEQAILKLKKIINSNEPTYSSLALFFLIEEKLITDDQEILKYYDQLINKNKFDDEMKNILIYKKALTMFEYFSENEMIETLKPIMNTESLLKSQTLLLLGDFFVSRENFIKAKDTYLTIISSTKKNNFYKVLAKNKMKKIDGKIN